MNKKVIAVVMAGILAIAGVGALVAYAQGADERAYGDAELTSVLVVTAPVPAGSPADRLAGSVKLTRVPTAVKAEGAVTDLTALGTEVTSAALVPGEQLIAARFGAEAQQVDTTDLPAGMQRIDLLLAAPRVPSGVDAGDLVGILASYAKPDGSPGATRMAMSKVRVLALETGVTGASADAQVTDGIRVTLAVSTNQAEKLANVAEFGKIWLTSQNDKADTKGSKTTESKDVL